MQCKKCFKEVDAKWNFCPQCGDNVVPTESFADKSERALSQFFASDPNKYENVAAQVFEVVVRQALAGAPWREICAGPMAVNRIDARDVEAEVNRRLALMGKPPAYVVGAKTAEGPWGAPPETPVHGCFLPLNAEPAATPGPELEPLRRLIVLKEKLTALLQNPISDIPGELQTIVDELDKFAETLKRSNTQEWKREGGNLQNEERELHRTTQPITPNDDKGPHHITWS